MRPTLTLGLVLIVGCRAAEVERPPPDTPPDAISAAAPAAPAADSARLEVRFLDVGQGDATLVTSGGRAALIDAGPADRIVALLRDAGVDTLDLLVASHNHADHIGGADAVLDSLPVRFYLDNGFPASTRIQQRVLERVEREGVVYLQPTRRTISLGDARLRILPPALDEGDEQNDRSVGVIVEMGDFEALLTGDSETAALNAFMQRDTLPDVEVLKAAHHGSRNGVTPAWLARTRPEIVVVSLAADNSYGHPHASAMRYYCAGGRRVYRTDRSGTVTVEVTGGGEYRVREEREAAPACAAGAGAGQSP